ncbi:MAG: hypothetical protein ACI8YQ_001907 [Polaribacter sp.]|jgi:hypothetical protein
MYKLITLVLLLFTFNSSFAQLIDQDASAPKSVNALALEFYRIDFTKGQRAELEGKELELIFTLSESGRAVLEEVNGLKNQIILDSLKQCTNRLPEFNPKIKNGVAKESLYFLQLIYPTYEMTSTGTGYVPSIEYKKLQSSDFKFIEEKKSGFEYYLGVIINHHLDNPADYIGVGIGVKSDFIWSIRNEIQLGLDFGFYSSKLKQNYPISSIEEQEDWQQSVYGGLLIGKKFRKISAQLEFNFAYQDVTERDVDNVVSFNGWNAGLLFYYPINLNYEIFELNKTKKYIHRLNLNLHLGIRLIQLSEKETQGTIIEFGVGFRFDSHRITNYQLK